MFPMKPLEFKISIGIGIFDSLETMHFLTTQQIRSFLDFFLLQFLNEMKILDSDSLIGNNRVISIRRNPILNFTNIFSFIKLNLYVKKRKKLCF